MAPIALLLLSGLAIAAIILLHQATIRRSRGAETSEPLHEWHTVRFLRFPLRAFFKLISLIFGVCGFCYGVFLSVTGLCGGRVNIDFFGLHLRGEEAILFAPLLCPLLGLLAGAVSCLPAWPVANWLIRRTRGIDLAGVIANLPQESNDTQG